MGFDVLAAIGLCATIAMWVIDHAKQAGERKAAEAREKIEHARAEKAEAELLAIRRRGDAPLLAVGGKRFNGVYVQTEDPGNVHYYAAGNPHLLCFYREEVERDLAANDAIIFVVENRGQYAPLVEVKLDGQPIEIRNEADLNSAKGLQFLVYPYDPGAHGKPQTIEMRFQAESGRWDTHLYRTVHGRRVLVRIDPA